MKAGSVIFLFSLLILTACSRPGGDPVHPSPILTADSVSIRLNGQRSSLDSLMITSNIEWEVSASAGASDWLNFTPANGRNNSRIYVSTKESNDTDSVRSAQLIVAPLGNPSVHPLVITISQNVIVPDSLSSDTTTNVFGTMGLEHF